MKKISKRIISTLLMLVMLVTLLPTQEVQAASKIKLNRTSATIVVGQTLKLKVTGTKKKVTWSSTKKNIASVSNKGVVKGKKSGNTVIVAKVGNKKYKCKVKVLARKKVVAKVNKLVQDAFKKDFNVGFYTNSPKKSNLTAIVGMNKEKNIVRLYYADKNTDMYIDTVSGMSYVYMDGQWYKTRESGDSKFTYDESEIYDELKNCKVTMLSNQKFFGKKYSAIVAKSSTGSTTFYYKGNKIVGYVVASKYLKTYFKFDYNKVAIPAAAYKGIALSSGSI